MRAMPAFLLLVTCLAFAPVSQADDVVLDPARVVGTYQGQLWSNGEMTDVTTTISVNQAGDFIGTYRFREGKDWYDGSLTKFRVSGSDDLTFIWQDEFGFGSVVLTFSKDGREFAGWWSTLDDGSDAFPWSGQQTK